MSLADGLAAKDSGIALVMSHNVKWRAKAIELLPDVLEGRTQVTGEDVRLLLLNAGLHHPSHHNAWGGFIGGLVGKCLTATGLPPLPMRETRSHARKTPIYNVMPRQEWLL